MDELEVRRAVRDTYGRRADDACGVSAACCDTTVPIEGRKEGAAEGVTRLGVGDTVAAADLKPGETVVDLGSGPGSDLLRAAEAVGPTGRAIGVDATPEMVFAARQEIQRRGIKNAEVRLGEIEHMPLEAGTVDVVLSDCVINLSPEKAQVFRDAFRVLRPGGRLVVADVYADRELSPAERADTRAWCGCVSGAVREDDYSELLRAAGFAEIQMRSRAGPYVAGFHTGVIAARKPAR